MNFQFAFILGKASFWLVWLASGYYWLRIAALGSRENSLLGLEDFVPVVRGAHPYIGLSLLLLLPYHAYVMFSIYQIAPKTLSGILSMSAVIIMLVLGLALWRDRSNLRVRKMHRFFMYIVLGAAIIHKLVQY